MRPETSGSGDGVIPPRASDGTSRVVPGGDDAIPSAGARASATTPRCDLCGGRMIERHCKLICASCGYQRDCSDP
jgi:ribosomal protein L37E